MLSLSHFCTSYGSNSPEAKSHQHLSATRTMGGVEWSVLRWGGMVAFNASKKVVILSAHGIERWASKGNDCQ